MKRRDFISWIGVGAIATSLPVAIAACTPEPEVETSEDPSGTDAASSAASGDAPAEDFVPVGTTADLEQQGYLSSDEALDEPVIVIADPSNPAALIALSAKCTHNGCSVAWQEDLFACPCHGSKFNPDGSVVNGPASEPLAQLTAKVER